MSYSYLEETSAGTRELMIQSEAPLTNSLSELG